MTEKNSPSPPPSSSAPKKYDPSRRKEIFSRFGERPSFSVAEVSALWVFRILAYLTIAITIAIITVLMFDAVNFFREVSVLEYLTGTEWDPLSQKKFGVLPLLKGTLMIAIGSCLVAVPLGLGTAVYLTLYAPRRVQDTLGPIIEILGGIPTVVYGFFAIVAVTPFLKLFFPDIKVFNALSGSIVVGIGIMPMVSSLSAEALRLVPKSIRNAGFALGMGKFHVVVKIMIPAAASGIVSSIILAFARAVGETMAVTMAAGQKPGGMVPNYLDQIQTMTAFIVQISSGDAAAGTVEYYTIYALGLTLFLITFIFNYLAMRVVRKFREVY